MGPGPPPGNPPGLPATPPLAPPLPPLTPPPPPLAPPEPVPPAPLLGANPKYCKPTGISAVAGFFTKLANAVVTASQRDAIVDRSTTWSIDNDWSSMMNMASVLTFACTNVAAQPPPTPVPPVLPRSSVPLPLVLPSSIGPEPPLPLRMPAEAGGGMFVVAPTAPVPEPRSPTTLPPSVLPSLQPVGPTSASSETPTRPEAIQTFRPIASMVRMASPHRGGVNSARQ